MRLEQFEQIIVLARTGSFSQAARVLYISQPNLSQSVRALENELGFPLFLRTSSGVVPTRQGWDLIEHFKIIQSEYDLLRQYSKGTERAMRRTLKVATLNFNQVGPLFADLVRRRMGTPIDFSFLHHTSLNPVIEMVASCQVDFALTGILYPYSKNVMARLQNKEIEYHGISGTPLSLVTSLEHPLTAGGAVTLSCLEPYTLVYYGSNKDDPSYSLPHLTGLRERVKGLVRVNNSTLFYDLLRTSDAVGLVASSTEHWSRSGEPGIAATPLVQCEITSEYGWIKLRRLPLSDIASELLESVKALLAGGERS